MQPRISRSRIHTQRRYELHSRILAEYCYDLNTVFTNTSSATAANNTGIEPLNPLKSIALNVDAYEQKTNYSSILYYQQPSLQHRECDRAKLGARHIRFFEGIGCDQTVKNSGGAPVEQWPYVAWSCVSEEAACFDMPFGSQSCSIGNADMRYEDGCVEHELRGSAVGLRVSGAGVLVAGISVIAIGIL